MLREVGEIYLASEGALLQSLRVGVAQGDTDSVALTAHRLRGSAGAFEAEELCVLAQRIEEFAMRKDRAMISQVLPEIELVAAGLRQELERAISVARR
jgi:HPt (histidine-containing phosphotransfer) domain-containing protein